MAKKSEVFIGAVFSRLTVVSETFVREGSKGRAAYLVTCTCLCGSPAKGYWWGNLGTSTYSCGCFSVESNKTHGQSLTPEHRSWKNMLSRTCNPNRSHFHFYKDRAPPERWKIFENFFADMGFRPEGMSLERKDNTKPYSPENCVWASQVDQVRNTSSNVYVQHEKHGVMTFSEATRLEGVKTNTARSHRNKGKSLEFIFKDQGWVYTDYETFLKAQTP